MLEVEPTGQRAHTATEVIADGGGIFFRREVAIACARATSAADGGHDD